MSSNNTIFAVGTEGFIFGLKNQPQLNGSMGKIISCGRPERIGVQLESGRKIAVKPVNIPVVLKNIPGKGKGLVATRTFQTEDTIFQEDPFLRGPLHLETPGFDEWRPFLKNLCDKKYEKLCRLSGGVSTKTELEIRRKFGNRDAYNSAEEFEKMNKIIRIFEVNCFNAALGREIYFACSHLNHSCIPNAVREQPNGKFTIDAVGTINPGDEVCLSYEAKLFLRPRAMRQWNLQQGCWGFECCCDFCKQGAGPFNGQEVYYELMQEIRSGNRDVERMNALNEKFKQWLAENYPYPYGDYILEDLGWGIKGAILGLV